MITKIEGKCQYEDCDMDATYMAKGRSDHSGGGHPTINVYCYTHATIVADEQNPEYIDNCPNCGCMFGVN